MADEHAKSICHDSVRGLFEPLECICIDSRRARVAKRTICRTLGSEHVRTIWDYVYRRFGIAESENAINTMCCKLPRLSDLISLDACRSKIMLHLTGNQTKPLLRNVQREFHTLRKIYRLLIPCAAYTAILSSATFTFVPGGPSGHQDQATWEASSGLIPI